MATEIITSRKGGTLPRCNCVSRVEALEKAYEGLNQKHQLLEKKWLDFTEDLKRQEAINKELVGLGILQDA